MEESKELTETRKVMLPEINDRSSLAVSLSRAEIDQQISTAHAYPRSVSRVVDNIMSLVTLDEQTAEECIYALPRGKKPIRGPSIRFAEIVMSQWGNCRVGARIVHVDRIERYVEAEGVFHDLETNAATTSRVRRRLSDREGGIFSDDMIIVTGNAACAIAKRNAITGGVPKAVWRGAYDAVESVIIGDLKTLAERRERGIKSFAQFGVKPEEIFAQLGVGGENDITLEHIAVLIGMYSAIKNGESTVEEMFPKTRIKDGGAPKSNAEKLRALAGPHVGATPAHDPETGEVKGHATRDAKFEAGEGDGEVAKEEAKAEHAKTKRAPTPTMNDATADVLLSGQLAARQGEAEFQKWWRRLSAPDAERAKPHLDELRKHIPE